MENKLNIILVLILMIGLSLMNNVCFQVLVVGLLFVIATEIDKNKMIK